MDMTTATMGRQVNLAMGVRLFLNAKKDYTGRGVESAVFKTGRSSNQNGVVRAVQDWMIQESGHPLLTVRHTIENFTPESLAKDGFDFDKVLRRDRNPSWYIYKP